MTMIYLIATRIAGVDYTYLIRLPLSVSPLLSHFSPILRLLSDEKCKCQSFQRPCVTHSPPGLEPTLFNLSVCGCKTSFASREALLCIQAWNSWCLSDGNKSHIQCLLKTPCMWCQKAPQRASENVSFVILRLHFSKPGYFFLCHFVGMCSLLKPFSSSICSDPSCTYCPSSDDESACVLFLRTTSDALEPFT